MGLIPIQFEPTPGSWFNSTTSAHSTSTNSTVPPNDAPYHSNNLAIHFCCISCCLLIIAVIYLVGKSIAITTRTKRRIHADEEDCRCDQLECDIRRLDLRIERLEHPNHTVKNCGTICGKRCRVQNK